MSSSAGPSRVSRPRRSSASISNGSTASSTGTADGARTGASALIFVSGDCETMALYLGVEDVERKGLFVVAATRLRQGFAGVVALGPPKRQRRRQAGTNGSKIQT